MSTVNVIIGATRGFGRSCALGLAKRHGGDFVITGRNGSLLESVSAEIKAISPSSNVTSIVWDLSQRYAGTPEENDKNNGQGKQDDLLKVMSERVIAEAGFGDRDTGYIILNAGTIGDQDLISSRIASTPNWETSLTTNVTSLAMFLSVLIGDKKTTHDDDDNNNNNNNNNKKKNNDNNSNNVPRKHGFVVNVSSLAAVEPLTAWGQYCAVKAARDMLIRVAATENPVNINANDANNSSSDKSGEEGKTDGKSYNNNSNKWVYLNYAPGPLDTDMQAEIRAKCAHEETRVFFDDFHKNGSLIDPNVSAQKMIDLISKFEELKGKDCGWTSGDHVDYFEIDQGIHKPTTSS